MLFIKEEFVDTKGVIKINENYVKKKFVRSHGSGIYNYLCNQCLSPLMLLVRILSGQGVQHYVIKFVSEWFSLGPPVSSTNKTDCHDKAEITNKQKHNLLHFVLKLLIYINIWFRYMLHIVNGLID